MIRFRSVLTAAICAVVFALSAFVDFGPKVVNAARTAWAFTIDVAVRTFAGPVPMNQPADVMPEKRLSAASRFLLRLVKRDRPTIQATWRMCPSI